MSQTTYQDIDLVYKGNHDAWQKYSIKLAMTLDPEDVKDAQHVRSNTNNKKIKIEMPFNRLMIEFLEGRDTEELFNERFRISRYK